MTPAQRVERDRQRIRGFERDQWMPKPIETMAQYFPGPLQRAYESSLEALNSIDTLGALPSCQASARAHIIVAAELLAAEIGDKA